MDIAIFAAHLRLLGFQRPHAASNLLEVEEVFIGYAQSLDPDLEPDSLKFLIATTFPRLAGIRFERDDGERIASCLLDATGMTHRFGRSTVQSSGA